MSQKTWQRVGLCVDRERVYTDLLHRDQVDVRFTVTLCRLVCVCV